MEGLTREPPAAKVGGSSWRKCRCRVKCCPADATYAADIEGEGCLLAKEGDTYMQIISVEVVLSWQHLQSPDPNVHVQTISTEPEVILGKPGAIEEGAYIHNDCVELDLIEGQPGNLNTNTLEEVAHLELDLIQEETSNAPMHLEGIGPEVLMDAEEDCLLELEEDGATRKVASIEGDISSHVKLQDPGVSCLAMQEDTKSLTLPLPPPPTTSEAASTQHSPAINAGSQAIPVPDHSADLELQLQYMTCQPPMQGQWQPQSQKTTA